MRGLFARLRSFWRGFRHPERLESEMDEEMRFHVDMESERLMRERGVAPEQARRQARVALGSRERYKAEGRDVRGLTRISDLSLDLKLGARMLVKYPALSIVGGLALAIGVGLGAAYLEVVNDFLHPTLPLDEGERIVGLQQRDLAANKPELRSAHDFVVWREELESVRDLGAFRSIERNVGVANGLVEPAQGAEISPSAFQMVRVPALLGRPLIDPDAQAGAPPVIVLGYHLWRDRFSGDPGVVGRSVQLGDSTSTVVGVMPEGFAFPVSHQFWVPLAEDDLTYGPRQGPAIQVFGRLAPGVTLKQAQAELSALGLRAAADSPATHEQLRPRVVKYTELFVGGESSGEAYLAQFLFVILLVVLSSNVATMVFARTATREHEIAMRFALGSSRGRIIAQFFVEALVLALAATVVGLTAVAWGTQWVTRLLWELTQGQIPFWLDGDLNVATVLYAIVLAVLGSLVAGVLPAVKATGSRLQERLRHSGNVGGSSLRFGGLWTGVIVVQVAFAVLILPPAMVSIAALAEADDADHGFAAKEYLSVRLEMEGEAEFQATTEELRRRLLARPQVSRVTFASRLPGMVHPEPWIHVEGADGGAVTPAEPWVMSAAVDAGFLDAFGAKIVAGRGFSAADRAVDPGVVVVNQAFVTEMLQGRNAIGRRVRYQTRFGEQAATGRPRDVAGAAGREPGSWYEIVGVVSNLGMDTNKEVFHSGLGPGIYHPLTPDAMGSGGSYSVRMAFHVKGDAESLAPQLREVAQAVHPALRLYDIHPLDGPVDRATQAARLRSRFLTAIAAVFAVIALFISTAGLYSVMSFTVWRQTRDIGIRIALGADARRILTGVFSRAMVQVGVGLIVGALMWVYFIVFELKPASESDQLGLFLSAGVVLMLVGLLACGVPVSRALRIEPTEALKDIG